MQFSLRVIGMLFKFNVVLLPLLFLGVFFLKAQNSFLLGHSVPEPPGSFTQTVRSFEPNLSSEHLIINQQEQKITKNQQEIQDLKSQLRTLKQQPVLDTPRLVSPDPTLALAPKLPTSNPVVASIPDRPQPHSSLSPTPSSSQATILPQSKVTGAAAPSQLASSSRPLSSFSPSQSSQSKLIIGTPALSPERLASWQDHNVSDRPIAPPSSRTEATQSDLDSSTEIVLTPANLSTSQPPDTQHQGQDDVPHIRIANDVAVGLIVADRKGQLNYGTHDYRKVQTAIKLMRRGFDLSDAAQRSKLSPSVLNQLAKWGADRPGSFRVSELNHKQSE